MTTQPFNPPPEDVPRILDDLASPECSLREIAEAYETSIDGLTLWLAQPDIAERFAAAESFAARRVRHAAACQLTAAVRAATNILDLFNSAVERRKLDDLTIAAQNSSAAAFINSLPPRLAALELQRRICETARKTSSLLLRLARFEHGSPRPRPTRTTDHAAPARVPQLAPTPGLPPESIPTPAIPTRAATDPQPHPTPTAAPALAPAPALIPEPSPPTPPLRDLCASASNSSGPPALMCPTALSKPASRSHSLPNLPRGAAEDTDAPALTADQAEASPRALKTNIGLPPDVAERTAVLQAQGRLPTADELLDSLAPCDTS